MNERTKPTRVVDGGISF